MIIESSVRECHSTLFVFDETDKIPIGLMDTIKAYIDFNPEIDGVDFRRSVFLFLRLQALMIIWFLDDLLSLFSLNLAIAQRRILPN